MNESLLNHIGAEILIMILCTLMVLAYIVGYRIGFTIYKNVPSPPSEGNTHILTAVFALMGLLLAFTFGMSGTRYENRRENIINEANAIGTAFLRSDMYEAEEKQGFKSEIKNHLESRIAYFEAERDLKKREIALNQTFKYGILIWQRASRLSLNPTNLAASNQMIPAVNEMLDLHTVRMMAEANKVPDSITIMLFILLITCAFFTGYTRFGKEKIDWIMTVGFCLLTVMIIYTILDLDRPRRGLIKLKGDQKAIYDLRKLIKENQG